MNLILACPGRLSRRGSSCLALLLALAGGARAQEAPQQAPPAPTLSAAPYDWSGYSLGGHMGYASGKSNWTASTLAGSATASGAFGLEQPVNIFKESGSWFQGMQAGYTYALPNRVVIGAEADVTFPTFPDSNGDPTLGGMAVLAKAGEAYSENVLYAGTVRGRIGYAPGTWLFYATGGLAWTYDQFSLTQLASGATGAVNLWRIGWAAGAGVEVPLADRWTARVEYLYTGYGDRTSSFPFAGQVFTSGFSQQEVRLGLNTRFGEGAESAGPSAPFFVNPDDISLHGQATGVFMANPPFHSTIYGLQSLPPGGEGRETTDVTLFLGYRLWQGAEFWTNPEIDQGFGVGNTLGVAGYVSGEAYKKGSDYPYARVQRFFVRQTIDLGGETQKVEADQNVFEGSQTENRVVLTVGRFFIPDLFDTNKYANNAKSDFLNWSLMNAGTFDFAGDAWGSTYGAAAEWFQGRFTLRSGVFDLTTTPAGGLSPNGFVNDPGFQQLEYLVEGEERHDLWGQPGKLKLLTYLIDGRIGSYSDAIAYIDSNPGADPGSAIQNVRRWNTRPGASLNLEQQVTAEIGVFARAGWGDGKVEIYDFTDIDQTVSGGVSVSGKLWGRPDDAAGLAGVINAISQAHQNYLNEGGMGLQIGDGVLPCAGPEKILEAYYSLPFYSSRLSLDYQLVANPAYNRENGPVSLFAARAHFQF